MEGAQEILYAIGKLEGKMDSMLSTQRDHFDRMNRIDQNMEGIDIRVRTVEKRQYGIFLVATVLWAGISLVLGKFFH